ncbi:uncharacterized protein LOC117218488 [Megalopta genalis]|uniref:uncharacterized protein LOC117218488 n=1 Tax=Megalopta genalis TaxID=115081 RepID=UPI003FD012F9
MGQDRNSGTDTALSDIENHIVVGQPDISYNVDKKDEKKYKCKFDGCDKAFVRPSRLLRHIRLHTGEKCYKCTHPGCDKAYTNSSHLKRHVETHNLIKKTYKCPECLLFLSDRYSLKRHYNRKHRDRDKLTCKECNLTFTKKYQLATHMSVHTGELHKCDQCNKSFTNFRQYKRHNKSHQEGTKTYPCTVSGCTDVFTKWRQYCVHQRTQHVIHHTCKDCDKVFLTKYRLKEHSKIHTEGRKSFPCPYNECLRVYHFKSNLDSHIRRNHLGQKFQCDICKVEISTKAKLAEHIQKLHMSEKLKRRTKKGQRKKRKDAGTCKKSAISALIGVNLPPKIEQMILKRETDIPYMKEFETTVPDDNSDL